MPTITINPKQREAAILSDLEVYCSITGTSSCYRLEWPSVATEVMVNILKKHRPDHERIAIPYQSLINNIIIADREQR